MWYAHFMRWFCRLRHRRVRVALRVNSLTVMLKPYEVIQMSLTMNVGQSVPLSILELDKGTPPAPITPPLPFDAPPSWSTSDDTIMTVSPAADGLTATGLAVGHGTATLTLSAIFGGVPFTATLDVIANAVVPQLGSIQIVAGTPS